MDAGAKQRLIGIDVADAPQETLIQQQRFDWSLAAARALDELLQTRLERLWPELFHPTRHSVTELQAAELAWIIIQQHAAIERDHCVRVSAGFAAREQLTGHAEMHGEILAAVELDDDKLAVTPH